MTLSEMAPVGADHQLHDRLLVSRFVAGGLDITETRSAQALVSSCPDCAALAADLRTLIHAMPSLPVARRPRDFRISPEQAAAIRGSFLERLLRRFAMPGTSVLQPLAGAAMALGLILVVIGAGIPGTTPAARVGTDVPTAPITALGAEDTDAGATPDTDAAPPAAAESPQVGPAHAPAASGDGRPGDWLFGGATDGSFENASPGARNEGPDASPAPAAPVLTDSVSGSPASPTDVSVAVPPAGEDGSDPERGALQGGSPGLGIVVSGVLLAAVGGILLLLRLIARRVVHDPALR